MHRWIGALAGVAGGGALNATVGDDISTLVIFLVEMWIGHGLPTKVAEALTRLTSGTITVVIMVAANVAWSRWGDKLTAKTPAGDKPA